MRYWDASALVRFAVDPPGAETVRDLAKSDPAISLWWGTPVECVSALVRLERDGSLTAGQAREAERRLQQVREEASEVAPTGELRQRAERLLRLHRLKAADALQLAAALVAARERPQEVGFVSLDQRLREAAQREGFTILPAAA